MLLPSCSQHSLKVSLLMPHLEELTAVGRFVLFIGDHYTVCSDIQGPNGEVSRDGGREKGGGMQRSKRLCILAQKSSVGD